MKFFLNHLGTFLGCLGMVICLYSGFTRLFGDVSTLQFTAINIFIVGIGFVTLGIFSKLCCR